MGACCPRTCVTGSHAVYTATANTHLRTLAQLNHRLSFGPWRSARFHKYRRRHRSGRTTSYTTARCTTRNRLLSAMPKFTPERHVRSLENPAAKQRRDVARPCSMLAHWAPQHVGDRRPRHCNRDNSNESGSDLLRSLPQKKLRESGTGRLGFCRTRSFETRSRPERDREHDTACRLRRRRAGTRIRHSKIAGRNSVCSRATSVLLIPRP